MQGKPKVGDVWRVRRTNGNDGWWLYQIVAVSDKSIVGVKDVGEGYLWAMTFDEKGVHSDGDEYYLADKTREAQFL